MQLAQHLLSLEQLLSGPLIRCSGCDSRPNFSHVPALSRFAEICRLHRFTCSFNEQDYFYGAVQIVECNAATTQVQRLASVQDEMYHAPCDLVRQGDIGARHAPSAPLQGRSTDLEKHPIFLGLPAASSDTAVQCWQNNPAACVPQQAVQAQRQAPGALQPLVQPSDRLMLQDAVTQTVAEAAVQVHLFLAVTQLSPAVAPLHADAAAQESSAQHLGRLACGSTPAAT